MSIFAYFGTYNFYIVIVLDFRFFFLFKQFCCNFYIRNSAQLLINYLILNLEQLWILTDMKIKMNHFSFWPISKLSFSFNADLAKRKSIPMCTTKVSNWKKIFKLDNFISCRISLQKKLFVVYQHFTKKLPWKLCPILKVDREGLK